MPTAKLSDSDHDRLMRVAEQEDSTVKSTLSRLIAEYLDDVGSIVGYCPECGECLRETHVESGVLRGEYVVCPNRWETPRGEELLHSEGSGKFRNRFAVDELEREAGDDSGDDPADGEEGEEGNSNRAQ